MVKTFDEKIRELEREKSELSDINFLQTQKKKHEEELYRILDNWETELGKKDAASELDKAKACRIKIKEFDQKIQNNSQLIENLDKKILSYQERKQRVKNIPLYRDTEEWIAEIFWKEWNYTDELYWIAKESNNKKLIKKFENRTLTEDEYGEELYGDLFNTIEKTVKKKNAIELPEWISEEIREILKGSAEFKCLSADEVENFLKKELKKNNGDINDKHIRNKFKSLDEYKAAYNLLKYLTTKYSQFTIFKETTKKSATDAPSKSKNDKLVEEALQNRSWELEQDKIKSDKLSNIVKIWKIENVEERCQKYIDLFEELWCKFDDKSEFIQRLINVINTHTHAQFDNGIQNVLSKMVQLNLKPEKSEWKWYLSYKLSPSYDARRILAYPNWEIFTICSHDEYEKTINMKPPVEKRRK